MEEREAVIELYLKKRKGMIAKEVYENDYARVLAQQTQGFSNADLDKLVNEASLIAKRKKDEEISIKSLREAFSEIVAGVKTNRRISEEDKRIVAYHEAGHAAAQLLLSEEGHRSVAYITITPHGESLGHVSPAGEERLLERKSTIKNMIQMKLAGRVVEEKILKGDYTTGAMGDLKQVNHLLIQYIARYGMSDSYMNQYIDDIDEHSDVLQRQIQEVRETLYAETKELIETHFDVVEALAEHLLVHTSIEQNELLHILEGTSYEKKQKE